MAQVFDRWDPAGYDVANCEKARAVGSLGGMLAGAGTGALATAWTGPGALVGGLVGGAIGAIGGSITGGLSGFANKTWTLKNNNGQISFSPEEGEYVRYNNDSGAEKDLVNHIFWNKKTGEVYYLDPDSKQYTKLNALGLDMSGGPLEFADDDLLDNAAREIGKIIKSNRNTKLMNAATQKALEGISLGSSLTDIAVPSPTDVNSTQLLEYEKRKLEANSLLEKMLVEEPAEKVELDNTIYYKYGLDEIDLKYFLHNIGTNLLSYIDSKGWNLAEKNAFIQSYENYKTALTNLLNNKTNNIYTDDAGTIQDTTGQLSATSGKILTDKNGEVYSSYDEITDKNLKKSARVFSPNEEVNTYIKTIGNAIIGAGKTKVSSDKKGEFDLNKHGFIKYWLNKINPAGGEPDIDPYLALDPVGPDGKRERNNRIKYLVHQLGTYLNNINNSLYDFSNSAFKSKETFARKIQEAINNLNNGWDTTDPASLLAIGITPDFYSAFMTDVANPLATPEETAAELLKNKIKAESDYIEQLKSSYDLYMSSGNSKKTSYIKDSRYNISNQNSFLQIASALENLGFLVDLSNLKASAYTLWLALKAALRAGEATVATPSGLKSIQEIIPIILPLHINNSGEKIEEMFTDSTSNPGVKYLDDPLWDIRKGAILCLKDGELYYDFIGNIKECTAWQQLKADFNKKYTITGDKPKYSFDKLGGVLKKLSEGGNVAQLDFDPEALQQLQQLSMLAGLSLEKEEEQITQLAMSPEDLLYLAVYGNREAIALSKNMSYERYNAKLRSPNGLPDFYNKDNGSWKTEDYVRLGAIAADIASIPLPSVSGAAVGLGGTIANLWADWADDTVTTGELWKNLGANLGMDLLSIIPVIGDVADAGRLTKNLVKMTPKISYILTAYGMLATVKNGSNIMESLNKVTSDEKLTVGDYQNIAQAISLIAGINGGVKAGVAKKLAKNKARQNDAIGLGLVDRNGKVLDFIFLGKKAELLKDLVKKGKPEDINAKLHEFEGFADYDVNTFLRPGSFGTLSPISRTKGENGTSYGALSPFKIDRKIDSFEIFDSNKLRSGYASRTALNTGRQDAVDVTRRFNDDGLFSAEELLTKLELEVNRKAADVIEANKQNRERADNALQQEIDAVTASKQAAEALIPQIKETADRARAILASLRKKYGKPNATYRGLNKASNTGAKVTNVKEAKARIESLKEKGADSSKIATLLQEIKDLETKLLRTKKQKTKDSINSDILTKKQELINSLELLRLESWSHEQEMLKEIKSLKYDTASKEYKTLAEINFEKMLEEYDPKLAELAAEQKKLRTGELADGTIEHTQAYNDFISSLGPGLTLNVGGKNRDVSQIIKDLGLYKKGGRLLFLQEAGKVEYYGNVISDEDIDWFNDYITNNGQFSKEARQVYGRITADNLNQYNDLQNNSYRSVFSEGSSNPAYGHESVIKPNKKTELHLLKFNTLASELNTRFNTMGKRLRSLAGANSGDSLDRGWVDGRPGSMTYLRHLGDKEKYVDLLNNSGMLSNNIEAVWNPKTKMVNFQTKTTPVILITSNKSYPDLNTIGLSTNPLYKFTGELLQVPLKSTNIGDIGEYKENIVNNTLGKMGKAISDYAPNPMEFIRYLALNRANIANAEKAIAAEKPYLQDPKEDYVYVHGDKGALDTGEKKKADLTSIGYNHTLTSDGAQQLAFIQELNRKGQEYADAGKLLDNNTWATTIKEDQAQRKENHNNSYMAAMLSRLSILESDLNKEKIRKALAAQIANDFDLFLLGWSSLKIQAKNNEKLALKDAAAEARMKLAIQNNPNEYGANLTPEELDIYNKAQIGAISSGSLTTELTTNLASALRKILLAILNEYFKYKGIEDDIYTADANDIKSYTGGVSYTPLLTEPKSGTTIAKDGTKLAIAKIRHKAKNADRFLKSVQKQLDSLDKKLDRISKSMYGLPKSEVIKPK